MYRKRRTALLVILVLVLLNAVPALSAPRRIRATEPLVALCTQLTAESAEASSTLTDSYGTYPAENLFDLDMSTAWVEGAEGTGIGETIELTYPEDTCVTELILWPGYLKSERLFAANGAPTWVSVLSGRTVYRFDISGCANSFTEPSVHLYLPKPLLLADGVLRLRIDDAREGSSYRDTCITELMVYGFAADEEAKAALAGTRELLTVTDVDFFRLCSEAIYLCRREKEDFYRTWTASVRMPDCSADTKAFLMYWYQYMISDERIRPLENGYQNVIPDEDASDLYRELTGETMDELAYQTILTQYADDLTDEGIVFSATGDFGDGGFSFSDAGPSVTCKNGSVILSGPVYAYDDAAGDYIQKATCTVYCAKDGPKPLSGLRITRITVK